MGKERHIFLALVALAGCYGRRPPPERDGARWDRPPMELRQGGQDFRDRVLADQVFYRLSESISLAADDIQVSASQGTVTLTGAVASADERERAERIARRTVGVREVNDELRVEPAARSTVTVDDVQLAKDVAARVKQQLPRARTVAQWSTGWEVVGPARAWDMDVDADGGILTLEGTAPSLDDIRKLVQAIRGVPGVRGIRNLLTVRGYPFYANWPYLGLYPPTFWW